MYIFFQLECSPDDSGFPPASMADWWHNGQRMSEVTSLTLRVAEATAAAAGNYSCLPRNEAGVHGEGGEEEGATVNVEVHVAPRFVKRMPQYSGELKDRLDYSIMICEIECLDYKCISHMI